MANVNLLPWRDEYRQEKKREFISVLMLLCITALVVSYIWVSFTKATIKNQEARNEILNREIAALEEKVKEIETLKRRREALETRMKIIQDLQFKRPLVVHYFDEIVRSVPEGLYFKTLERKKDKYSIKGITESNNRVSALMRNLDESKYFSEPNLKNVIAEEFDLSVTSIDPNQSKTSQTDQEKVAR